MSFSNIPISVKNLEHYYGNYHALKGINFDIEKGKVYGLLGKNGAGKTTSINIIMGFLQQSRGSVKIFGEESSSLSNETKRKIGLLHEGHLAYDYLTIKETEYFYKGFYHNWDSKIFNYFIEKLALPIDRKIKNMSCGQKSQVVLASLMAQNAEVLILDDFSMGLDAGYRRLFIDRLNEFVKEGNKTVLITSHIVQDLERFVDYAIVINKGNLIASSDLKNLGKDIFCYNISDKYNYSLIETDKQIMDISLNNGSIDIITKINPKDISNYLKSKFNEEVHWNIKKLSLEDIFIAITGKY